MMSIRGGNLKPAHHGYLFQDIATAYTLVQAIVERYESVVVDRKVVADDRLDDLEVRIDGRRYRRQYKSSQNAARQVVEQDFTGGRSSLRIDRLVLTHIRSPAEEYRLCATWTPPESGDSLASLLEPATSTPTITGRAVYCCRLKGEAIWPAGGPPIWAPLADFATPGAEFGRVEFLEFCRRFVIELAVPNASLQLAEPGPLERAVVELLAERVGIGRYPNHERRPTDVAALVIALATLARTQEASLTPEDIERELGIRVDFGRVAQAFPLEVELYHDRPAFRRDLYNAAVRGEHQLVVGPPGSGKSWELTRLAGELRAAGAIVARHYCYLEPGDAEVERRVTSDVFFANLLGDLVDAEPSLRGAGGARYAVGLAELEATLERAIATGRSVVLIVDGLDHIARVLTDSRALSGNETDIVERLATISLPQGVALVVGSQPGQQLDPLRAKWGGSLAERRVPPWAPADLAGLVDRHGVPQALLVAGITDTTEVARLRDALATRADGNPLYGRYLVRGLVAGLRDGSITSPFEWIAAAPAIEGDVSVYYTFLYRAAAEQAQGVADLLGVIDFAVAESDLREIVGALNRGWVRRALAHLEPVLTVVSGQGGVRIFHESFRRFMTQELNRQGRSITDVLNPVIDWLDARGFYEDAKAYRFLLPALRRADRGDAVLARIDAQFVSSSVAQAHPLQAVQRNLALAADVAAERCDWPALARCVELHRAAHTCFDESQNEWREFWVTYCSLFGPAALAERLLFDGRPTLSASEGLFACAVVDDAGGIAPWREYLALYDEREQRSDDASDTSDPNWSLTLKQSLSLSVVHGRLRLGECTHLISRLLEYLRSVGDSFHPLYTRRLGARFARLMGSQVVERIAERADPTRRVGARMASGAAAALYLGIADEQTRLSDIESAQRAATRALAWADTPELAAACIDRGAEPFEPRATVDPSSLPIAVGPDRHLHEAANVRAWVAAVRIRAADIQSGEAVLSAEERRVSGEGWYRCWLRFVLALARAEVAQRREGTIDVQGAFQELTRDVAPFRGTPRACDLWAIRAVIQESLEWGLRLLRTETDWQVALDALTKAASETATRMDREDGGPIPTGTVLEVLLPFATDPIAGGLVKSTLERVALRREAIGTYYPTHAEHALRLARIRHATGDSAGALEAWAASAVYLGAYGWHKDITLLDVVEGAPALLAHSRNAALEALSEAQPLTHAVLAHTDRRETNHVPNAWLKGLLQVDAAVGFAVVARTLAEKDDQSGWPEARAIRDAVAVVAQLGDPVLLDSVLSTLRFEADDPGEAVRRVDARVAPVIHLLAADRSLGVEAFRRVAAEVSGDGVRAPESAYVHLMSVAAAHGVSIPPLTLANEAPDEDVPTPSSASRGLGSVRSGEGDRLPCVRIPPFPRDATIVDLLAGLRHTAAQRRFERSDAWDDVVLSLGYHVSQLVDAGQEDEVRRLLRFWARDAAPWGDGGPHPLSLLAEALEAAGHQGLAATAYALAYTATRGGNGYYRFGDASHGILMDRAIALDPEGTRKLVADEVAFTLSGARNTNGLIQHLVERLVGWGEPETALAAWREAFTVVRHRLPLAPTEGWFALLRQEHEAGWPGEKWSVDEGLVALLLARLSDPRLAQKVNALDGVVRAIARRPDAVPAPLRWWLTRNTPVTSVLLVLDALCSAEVSPFPITHALGDLIRGYASCDLWGVSRLAIRLLERAGLLTERALVGTSSRPLEREALAEAELRTLMGVDVGGVIDDLDVLWPALRQHVARRLSTLFAERAHRDRAIGRYRLAFGRDREAHPQTPMLMWEQELFEVALHEALAGLREHLWASGKWTPDVEDAVLRRALPNSRLQLALNRSRTVRPAWPAAEEVTEGLSDLLTVDDDDPQYSGWTRLAIAERRYRPDPQAPHGRPVEEITVLAGAVAIPLGETVPARAMPLRDGSTRDWWSPASTVISFPMRLPMGPVMGLSHIVDWLGEALVPVPPAWLLGNLGLRPAEYGGPLHWLDGAGRPAVVLRTWWVRNPDIFAAESAACIGADIVVRPDVLERLSAGYGTRLLELRWVVHRPVGESRTRR